MAPEVSGGKKYDTKCDIYSLAIVAEEMFNIDNYDDNAEFKFKDKYENLRDLIEKMEYYKRGDVKLRPNCDEILKNKRMWSVEVDHIEGEEEIKRIIERKEYDTIADHFVYFFIKYKINK